MKKRFIIFLLILLISFGLFWVWFQEGLRPVSPGNSTAKVFTIEKGATIRDIIEQLEKERLIRSKLAFFLYIRSQGLSQKVQAGLYRLNPGMDAAAIATTLTRGTNDVWVTTLEGWRVDEIATKLSHDLEIPEHEFLKYSREGYMFPETYLIPRTATAAAVARLFQDTFEKKVTAQMREDAKKQGLSLHEVVILASIVEREGKNDDDRPIVAGILIKRLRANWPLQADATLQYVAGYQSDEKTWWKKELTDRDKLIDSPYNTYKYPGLPPTPISNPGLATIKAVIYSKESEYWYYLHSPVGEAHYAKTIEEHEENTRRYLQ